MRLLLFVTICPAKELKKSLNYVMNLGERQEFWKIKLFEKCNDILYILLVYKYAA